MPPPCRYRVIFGPLVEAEIREIFNYIAADSTANAAGMVETLLDAIDALQNLSHRYKEVTGSRQPRRQARSMPVPPYIVYYRVLHDDGVVRVLTVMHGARRQPKRFK